MNRLFVPAVLTLALAACDDPATPPADLAGPSFVEAPNTALAQEVRALTAIREIGPLARPAPVRPELVRLGQALAFDKVLSGNKDISCMTCHLPGFAHRRRAEPVHRAGGDRPRDRPPAPERCVHPAERAGPVQSRAEQGAVLGRPDHDRCERAAADARGTAGQRLHAESLRVR